MVLKANQLRHSYGRREVLRGVTFEVPPGALVGVVGENGAGKTTLLRILCGELAPAGGTTELDGRLGYCPQQVVLNDAFTVAQHLEFFQVAYGLADLSYAYELMEVLNFADYLHDRVSVLSGGTRQKLNLTIALMHDPEVLLLDEPYQGFDWETYLRFWDLARQVRARGRSVLVISHLAYDAERLDELHRLDEGVLHTSTTIHEGRC
ncbi:ABC transporter ATP-binding protein [Lentzea sp. NEAU-D7]|uniref:ABC transporter ATP-binding protein n=1 Tax=Lentzea sp. NEAU-D7 TaxID=2994667 RepID=UPI00224B8EB7|nr:ABC transporter ATP-binding protein [Lentzea sp. NEAU-D7]MCX2951576.1 ABC transporter ATP-binding protein [Lentzea sp. NEAU-D7]